MRHFLLFYEAGPEHLERRPEFRAMHLEHAWEASTVGSSSLQARLRVPSTEPS